MSKLVDEIYEITPAQKDRVPWLVRLLDSSDLAVRAAALDVLAHRFQSPDLVPYWYRFLPEEPDQDLLIPVYTALSQQFQGSKNKQLCKDLLTSKECFEEFLDGTQESLNYALLRIMRGVDTKAILKMDEESRGAMTEMVLKEVYS